MFRRGSTFITKRQSEFVYPTPPFLPHEPNPKWNKNAEEELFATKYNQPEDYAQDLSTDFFFFSRRSSVVRF